MRPKDCAPEPNGASENLSVAAWGDVTNPENHNASSFRYLVHTFSPSGKITALSVLHSGSAPEIPTYQKGDQSVNLLGQPERINDRVSLSMSLIDQDHR